MKVRLELRGVGFIVGNGAFYKRKSFVILLTCVFFLGCSGAKNVPQDAQRMAEFKDFIDEKSFEFTADTAHPMTTQAFNAVANAGLLPPGSTPGTIQLMGVSNYIRILGDSVYGNLPFYGERRFGGGPTATTGIEFKGVPDAYTQNYNETKGSMEIAFEISEKTERHEVSMTLFPNRSANVAVRGNHRTSIRFSGRIRAIENNRDE